ncbi:hypothetical protein M9458_033054 [Cirrhinus mrigala]|uniref:Uncharacterized protein n=1 Tax=Cirrhinus mrigala TaxID=683832 RepID=A0ABD0PHM4_CIRMR
MDSANAPTLQDILSANNARMDRQDEQMLATGRAVQALVAQVSEPTNQLQQLRSPAAPSPSPPPPPVADSRDVHHEPRLPTPEGYAAFLTKCSMYFSLQPITFASEQSKVALVDDGVGKPTSVLCLVLTSFGGDETGLRPVLADLRQGNRIVSDYSIDKWNEAAQWDMFLHGLADRILREIFTLELPEDLDGLISLALRVDSRLQRRDHLVLQTPLSEFSGRSVNTASNTVSPVLDHKPMQVGERPEKIQGEGYCRAAYHRANPRQRLSSRALLDSGAEGNFMDLNFAQQLLIPIIPLSCKISVNALNGQTLPSITHSTGPITMITSGNHKEELTFLLTNSPLVPVVLGHPWLVQHNPRVDWGHDSVSTWGESCYANCLLFACSSVSRSLLQESSVNLSNVPKEYLDLKEVFSKSSRFSSSASVIAREAMEKYISDSLAAGLIRPSSSPAGAGFFFVKKKDDYQGLNNITVKNTYPLPLMSSAFERLQGASVFTKLDLRNAYHLVRIKLDEEVGAV